ncbi:MAG TPA: DUF6134 family protein [Chitinophagaceae bacterium]|nr:DUF6134 family protein [Chitinophagaceae bacterium]
MTPTILYFLLRYYRRHCPEKAEKIQQLFYKISRVIMLIIFCTLLPGLGFSQEKKLEYNIKRKGDVVGNIRFIQTSAGNRTTMKLESEVKTKVVFTFTAHTREETIYDNGIMTWSSIFRKMNGNVKADKKTKAAGNNYTVFTGSKSVALNHYPIRYNMLSIYAMEPINNLKVYSDNFEQDLEIQKIKEHHYKIKFPDGNYNEYFYSNGICSKIEIYHSLYRATIELNI